jgi:hypothetical protein
LKVLRCMPMKLAQNRDCWRFKSAMSNYLITYLLTYSMKQSPSWEANRSSFSQ